MTRVLVCPNDPAILTVLSTVYCVADSFVLQRIGKLFRSTVTLFTSQRPAMLTLQAKDILGGKLQAPNSAQSSLLLLTTSDRKLKKTSYQGNVLLAGPVPCVTDNTISRETQCNSPT